jgi:lipopolysaccharide export system permease protein
MESVINGVYKAFMTVLHCGIMFGSKIHRYIIKEVLSPTMLCIVVFTLVMVMGRAVTLADLIINKGVSPADILILLLTLLPTFFTISLPLSFLMGIMIGFGRMSADSEIVALKAAGVGLAKMSRPVFALALAFVLLVGITSLWLKPLGFSAFATKSFEIAQQKATVAFQPRVFMKQFNNLVLYANDIDIQKNQLRGLFIVEKDQDSSAWVFADSGGILSDKATETVTIRLKDGVIHRQLATSADNLQVINFRSYDIQPKITDGSDLASRSKKPKELPTGKLLSSIADEKNSQKLQRLQAELHERLTLPLAPLLFALLGLPFSMQSHRSGRSGGFIMGLVIFLGYHFIQSTAFTLTKEAATPPLLVYWLPQMLLGCAGVYLLRQASLEKPNMFSAWLDQSLLTVQKWARKNVVT